MSFYQTPPQKPCLFKGDPLLQTYLKQHIKDLSRLESFSKKLNWDSRIHYHYPQHIPYDPWGKRSDKIELSALWQSMHDFSAKEGLIAMTYENTPHARLYQMSHIYVFHHMSAFFSCPLAMTDGAVLALEKKANSQVKKIFIPHLLSRDPHFFWTSGQWMTEITGGSDVSRTFTEASFSEGLYYLKGQKWFSSATTSHMSLALAKTHQGLSLFAICLKDEKGRLQNIKIRRLKDKLGTKALPTAELELERTPAYLVGELGEGIKNISPVLNTTRLYNAVCAISEARSALLLAQDYALKRQAFGKTLIEHSLHKETLDDLEAQTRACFCFTFYVVKLFEKVELKKASEEEIILWRLLTPVVKLFTAKVCLKVVSEVLESFGGAGYIEDTDLPRRLRDTQVFSIWEGTTNVLSLDVVRVFKKYPESFDIIQSKTIPLASHILQELSQLMPKGIIQEEKKARRISFRIAELFSLLSMAELSSSIKDMEEFMSRFSQMKLY